MPLNNFPDLSQLAALTLVARQLEEINEKVVYVGGCTTNDSMLANEKAAIVLNRLKTMINPNENMK